MSQQPRRTLNVRLQRTERDLVDRVLAQLPPGLANPSLIARAAIRHGIGHVERELHANAAKLVGGLSETELRKLVNEAGARVLDDLDDLDECSVEPASLAPAPFAPTDGLEIVNHAAPVTEGEA